MEYLAICKEWVPSVCQRNGGIWTESLLWVAGDSCMTTNILGKDDYMLSEDFWNTCKFKDEWIDRKLSTQKIKDIQIIRRRE